MKIHYLSNHPPITNWLKTKYTGLEFEKIQLGKELDHINTLLIIEPFNVNNRYIYMTDIWRNYLKGVAPQIKMITAAFIDYQHSNFIDLLAFSDELTPSIIEAAKVNDEYSFPWDESSERPKWAVGMDMVDKLRQFFKGHGDQSVIAQLSKIRTTISIFEEVVEENSEERLRSAMEAFWEIAVEEMDHFYNRWNNYQVFFKYLPFIKQQNKIDQNLILLNDFFKLKTPTRNDFLTIQCFAKITCIDHQLNEIKKYVPETASIPNLIN